MKKLKSLGKNYIPGSMSFSAGFMGPRGDVGYVMKFSIRKAKAFVKGYEDEIDRIVAGLDGDFNENSETIFEEGKWIKPEHFYDHSIWATPIILVEYKDKPMEAFECWSKGVIKD